MTIITDFLIKNGMSYENAEWIETLIHEDMKPIILLAIELLDDQESRNTMMRLFWNFIEIKDKNEYVLIKGKKTNYILESDNLQLREAVQELDEYDEDYQPIHSPVLVFLEDGIVTID